MTQNNDRRDRSILIAELPPEGRLQLVTVSLDAQYETHRASSLPSARRALGEREFDLVILASNSPAEDELRFLKQARREQSTTDFLLISGNSFLEDIPDKINGLETISNTASDHQVLSLIDRVISHRAMKQELTNLRQQVAMSYGFDNIVGNSEAIESMKENIARLAPTDITIEFYGEPGSGRSLVATSAHHHSKRRRNPLIRIDCGAMPATALEPELFGTGRIYVTSDDRMSAIEKANAGSLLLTDIDKMAYSVQEMLAEFLKDFQLTCKDSGSAKMDIRILVTSSGNLAQLVKEGKFSKELFNRLNVLPLKMPALRDRTEDIPDLVDYFLLRISRRLQKSAISLSEKGMEALLNYTWPGNVAELEATLQKAAGRCCDGTIECEDIELAGQSLPRSSSPTDLTEPRLSRGSLLADSQRNTILSALVENNWNFTQTAQQLGIGRTTLWRKVKKYDLKKDMAL